MNLMEKWHQLQQRERRLIMTMGIAVVIALFYFLILGPLQSGVAKTQQGVVAQQKNLKWMQQSVSKIILSRASGSKARKAKGSLSQRVNSSAGQHKVKLSRIQPQKSELNVRIDDVEFDKLLAWMQKLEELNIAVVSADIKRSDVSGHVQVRKLMLRSL